MKQLNNRTMKNTKILVLVVLVVLVVFPKKAAASELSLGIYPPIIQIQTVPPAVMDTPITIHNYGGETVALEISLKPFTAAKGENGEVLYMSGKNPLVYENIKVRDNDEVVKKVVIGPRQNKTLNLYIDIPKDESVSDHYFSVVFISENKSKDKLNQSKIQAGIATNVLLSIGSKEMIMGKIVEFSTPLFLEKGPVPFTVRLKNQSNHFITPQGTISIKNIFGKTIGQVKLSPVNILAGSIRSQQTLWQEALLFGPYTATLNIDASDNVPILLKTVTFFVFPLWTFIALTGTVIIIFLTKNRLKRYRNKNLYL